MIPEASNSNLELNSVARVSGSDSTDDVKELLDLKLKAMRVFKTNIELNARQIGDEVNDIIDRELWRKAGYTNVKHCLRKRFKEIGSPRTLLRYGDIARKFTDDHIRSFGTTILDALLRHETLTGQQVPSDSLGEQEIRLKQKDGSEVVKKVKDCSANEVIRSNARVRKSAETKPVTSQYGSRSKLVLAGAGAVMLVVGELLPSWELAKILAAIGATLLIIGANQLIRHAFNWLKTFIRSGQALEVLAVLPSKLSALSRDGVRGLQWTWSFVRSGQLLHALAKLPSRVRSLGGAVVRGLGSLWSFIRSGQILHALAKVPSRVSSLVRAAVGGLQHLVSSHRKQTVDTVSKAPSKSPSPNAGTDMSSPPPVSTSPSQSPHTGDGNTKLAA